MTHPFSYRDRRVVVTGGASGVGAELLEILAELDAAHVTVIDREAPRGPHNEFLPADLADEASARSTLELLDGPVHALFNNAGVADTQPPATVLSVNYLALRTLSDGLVDRIPDGGAIVNTASLAGNPWPRDQEPIDELLDLGVADGWDPALRWVDEHLPSFAQGPYNFSKEVVVLYTLRTSRPNIRRGVRTNCACPGSIDTPLLPDFRKIAGDESIDWNIREMMGRPAAPREVASALAFLGSPAAAYVNGVNLNVDAGFAAARATGQLDMTRGS
jgi:NAD(P)-dependent dehydrogenase (short-subunit alcohol dehydrogenase family)